MARQRFVNNFETTIATALAPGALSFDVQPGQGAALPALSPGDFLLFTLTTAPVETTWEIVKVVTVVGDTLTIEAGGRAQEGTLDQGWGIGSKLGARLTADSLEAFYRNDELIEEPFTPVVSVGGVLTLDLAVLNNNFQVTLFENVTSVLFTNIPVSGKVIPLFIEFIQDVTGNWTVTGWDAAVGFTNGGSVPVVTAAPGSKDLFTGYTLDDGVSINLGRAMEDVQ